ncbi:MAG: D-alanyl-D-alanine carboxypeptidase [Clostridiales bacterium]|nr:D-alanyl-D-alanine carboxypeptidase [Clostridiales bacterium]
MRSIKKLVLIPAFFVLINILSINIPVSATVDPGFELESKGVYMASLDSDGDVIYAKNENTKLRPASTVKIMTAILALEMESNLDKIATITYDAFDEFHGNNPNYQGASQALIEPTQKNITYRDLVNSLMLASACESANILAYNLGGNSIPNFIKMMNDKAQEIGAVNTHFANPHGLHHEGNYTTAYDLYLITKYAIENVPGFMEIVEKTTYKMPPNKNNPNGYNISSTITMQNAGSDFYYEGVKGVKTGSINYFYELDDEGNPTGNKEAGSRSLVTTATKNGYSYIIVTLESPFFTENGEKYTASAINDHTKLYNWAFTNFKRTLVIEKNEGIENVKVSKGKDKDEIEAIATEDLYYILPSYLDKSAVTREISFEKEIYPAPIEKGQSLGIVKLLYGGKQIGEVQLVAKDSVELSMIEEYKERASEIIDSGWFKASIIILFLLISTFLIARTIQREKKRKMAKFNRKRRK